jgi:hypothetical protein
MGSSSSRTSIENIVRTELNQKINNILKSTNEIGVKVIEKNINKISTGNTISCNARNNVIIENLSNISGSTFKIFQVQKVGCMLSGLNIINNSDELKTTFANDLKSDIINNTSLVNNIKNISDITQSKNTEKFNSGGIEGTIKNFTDMATNMFTNGKKEDQVRQVLEQKFNTEVNNIQNIQNILNNEYVRETGADIISNCAVGLDGQNNIVIRNLKNVSDTTFDLNQEILINAVSNCVLDNFNSSSTISRFLNDNSVKSSSMNELQSDIDNKTKLDQKIIDKSIQQDVMSNAINAFSSLFQYIIIIGGIVAIVGIIFGGSKLLKKMNLNKKINLNKKLKNSSIKSINLSDTPN